MVLPADYEIPATREIDDWPAALYSYTEDLHGACSKKEKLILLKAFIQFL